MKKTCAIILTALLLTGLLGCSAAPDGAAPELGRENQEFAPSEAPAASDAADWIEKESIAEESSQIISGNSGLGDMEILSPLETGQKLVYNASYALESTAFIEDYNKIIAAIKEMKGYIANETMSGSEPAAYGDPGRTLNMQIRIPADKYEGFAAKLSGIGEIVSKQLNTEDITQHYYDTEARIKLLEGRYEKLEEHMKKATRMEDIITLESEMSNILYELDVLKGNMKYMDNMVQYSTFTLSMTEVVKAEDVALSKESVGERAGDAFNNSLKDIGVFFEGFAVVLAGAVPVLVILGAAAGIAIGIVMLVRKLKKKKQR